VSRLPFESSAEFIAKAFGDAPHDIAFVLGSGLGGFTRHLSDKASLETTSIPDYPASTVVGHKGEIVSASLNKKRILVFSGRSHYYETGSTVNASATAIVSYLLGIKKIVLTNAAGILNALFVPGDLMLITDHVNLTSRNVLQDLKSSVCNIERAYSERLSKLALSAAEQTNVDLKKGIYVGLTGPSYETPAEVTMYRKFGGDAVGMSTIHEAVFARSVGMEVLGISCLTNYSTGITPEKLSHEEVTDVGARVDEKFTKLLSALVTSL